jgi:hypothetical protein
MDYLPIEKLRSFTGSFDLFTESKPFKNELLELELLPPLPVAGNELVWGFNLLYSAAKAGYSRLPVIRISKKPLIELLRIAITIEDRAGNFTWGEMERIYNLLKKKGSSEFFNSLSPLLLGHEDSRLFARVKQFSSLKTQLKVLVAEKLVDIKTALQCNNWQAALIEDIGTLLRSGKNPLSFSKRRIILNQLLEVSVKHKIPEEKFLSLVSNTLNAADPLKTAKALRFPELTAMEERFLELKGKLLTGTGIKLTPPSFFEGEEFNISFSFSSTKTLDKKINYLKTFAEKTDELFELLY